MAQTARNILPASDPSSTLPFHIPSHFIRDQTLRDRLKTESSALQDEVVTSCLPLVTAALDPSQNPFDFNSYGLPPLERREHVDFLREAIEGEYPAKFIGVDASRPWILYWALNGLALLGEDVGEYEDALIKTLAPFQASTGGFGGGHGHIPHLAATYPAILSIAVVASALANPSRLYALINRHTLHAWLSRLKQPSGGFRVTESGEEDVRGAYIAMVLISLLDLPLTLIEQCNARSSHGLRTFTDDLPDYLGRCQSRFDGGVGEGPGREAHGAYAFCAIAALCLLGEPKLMLERYLDLPSLVRWLAARQNAPEGGFSGRTNKLVDGCYSHWVGGCFPLIQGALNGPVMDTSTSSPNKDNINTNIQIRAKLSGTILPRIGPLSSSEGLARYILSCCQQPGGALRDKPGKSGDSYHTNYTLAGLSSIQYQHYYVSPKNLAERFAPGFSWRVGTLLSDPDPDAEQPVWSDEEEPECMMVEPLHPIYVIPHAAVDRIRKWAEKEGTRSSKAKWNLRGGEAAGYGMQKEEMDTLEFVKDLNIA